MNINPKTILSFVIIFLSTALNQGSIKAQSTPLECQSGEMRELYKQGFDMGEMSIKMGMANSWEEYKRDMNMEFIIEQNNINTDQKRQCYKMGVEEGMESSQNHESTIENW